MRPILTCLALCFAALIAWPAAAQGQFSAVARVGGGVVTNYELEQRIRFNQLLGAPGDLRAISLDQLVDDRLRIQEADRLGIEVTPEDVDAGMAEFAGRANLETDEFVAILGQAGVAEETFRAFVEAGVAWREAVRARFAPQAEITEAEINRAIAGGELVESGVRFLVNEIIIPAPTPEARAAALARARQIGTLSTRDAFERAARAYSAAGSAAGGGALNWLPAEALPDPVRAALDRTAPGAITEPIAVPGAIAVFLLRDVARPGGDRAPGAIDYAAFYIPGGRSAETLAQAAGIRARVDTCDDLYGVARGLPPERLERGIVAPSGIPADIAAELALLDANEVSTRLTRADGRTLVFLMLCDRVGEVDPETVDRGAVADRLRAARLARFADGYLEELRAETPIVRP